MASFFYFPGCNTSLNTWIDIYTLLVSLVFCQTVGGKEGERLRAALIWDDGRKWRLIALNAMRVSCRDGNCPGRGAEYYSNKIISKGTWTCVTATWFSFFVPADKTEALLDLGLIICVAFYKYFELTHLSRATLQATRMPS